MEKRLSTIVLAHIDAGLHVVRKQCSLLRTLPEKSGRKRGECCYVLEPLFLYQLQGSTFFYGEEHALHLQAGECSIVAPSVFYAEKLMGDDFLRLEVMGSAHSFDLYLHGLDGRVPLNTAPLCSEEKDAFISSYLENIRYWHLKTDGLDIEIGLVQSFLGMCKQSLQNATGTTKAEQAAQIIRADFYDADLNASCIARRLQCSSDYLSQVFSAEKGIALTKYLQKKRIEYAQAVLLKEDLSVAEVARAAGYHDPSYFIRVFKKHIGKAPGVFKQGQITQVF